MNVMKHFRGQIDSGATDQFFYGIESNGEVEVKRHRGTLDSFPTNLKFLRMVSDIPFFSPKLVNEDRKSIMSSLGFSRVGLWGKK